MTSIPWMLGILSVVTATENVKNGHQSSRISGMTVTMSVNRIILTKYLLIFLYFDWKNMSLWLWEWTLADCWFPTWNRKYFLRFYNDYKHHWFNPRTVRLLNDFYSENEQKFFYGHLLKRKSKWEILHIIKILHDNFALNECEMTVKIQCVP